MKPHENYVNGDAENGGGSDGGGGSGSGSGSSSDEEGELSLEHDEAPARALGALNALRKSRQHYDVVLLAGGAELSGHRAVLAAASPYLLEALAAPPAAPPAPAPLAVPGVEPEALRALLDYVYTGRARVRDVAAACALYRAAWRLRVEPARRHLAQRLAAPRALTPRRALAARALPDLDPPLRRGLDVYLADNFEEVCSSGALAALPEVRIELMRAAPPPGPETETETETEPGPGSPAGEEEEAPLAVAEAALAWLQLQAHIDLEELCSRTHLVYVDEGGALRDCGELPAARGDAPELQQYRSEAAARRRAPPAAPGPAPAAHAPLELGARTAAEECTVVAARRAQRGATRALLVLRGRLAAARVLRSSVAAGGGPGGALRGAADGGERRAALSSGRCALGAAALGGRLLVCGGYDRARVLRSCEAYDPALNAWSALADMRGPRARFPAARLGGCVYAIGGSDGHAELDSVDAWDPGRAAWGGRARLPLALSHAAAAAAEDEGALYVVGGWAAGHTLRRVLRYCPREDAWSDAPPLEAGRAQCGAVRWAGELWALGGCDAWHCLASTERLAAGAARWAPGPPLPTARRSMGACAWRGRLVAAGGSDGAASLRRTDWLEAGAGAGAGEWRAGPALRRARAALALAELAGALYAVGGFDGKEFLSCVECLYEPAGEWTTLRDPPPLPATPEPARDANGISKDANETRNDSEKHKNLQESNDDSRIASHEKRKCSERKRSGPNDQLPECEGRDSTQ